MTESKCNYDPSKVTGPIGMFHCPECGDMVLAGMNHGPPLRSDFEKEYFDEKERLFKEYLYKSMSKDDADSFWELMHKTPNFFSCMMEIWLRAEQMFRQEELM